MRIVTFNVQHARAPDGRVDAAALAGFCAGIEADVLCLQEVDHALRRSGRVDQAASVVQATGLMSVFGPARRIGLNGRYGNVLLVRGGLAAVHTLALPRRRLREPRAAILATADVDGGQVSIAGTHLSTDPAESVEQLEVVLDALAARPEPRVVLGDLNQRPERARPALEARGYTVAATVEPTYPAWAPALRIDHVAVQGLDIERVEVLAAAPVSDHRALLVEAS